MNDQTNAARIEAFIAEYMPEVQLTDWQREYIRRVFAPHCTCPVIDVSHPGDRYATMRGLDPRCDTHGKPSRIEGEDGPELSVPRASGGIVTKPTAVGDGGPPGLVVPPRKSGGPVLAGRPYPVEDAEVWVGPDGTAYVNRVHGITLTLSPSLSDADRELATKVFEGDGWKVVGAPTSAERLATERAAIDRANRRVAILLEILAGLAVAAVGIVLVLNLQAAL